MSDTGTTLRLSAFAPANAKVQVRPPTAESDTTIILDAVKQACADVRAPVIDVRNAPCLPAASMLGMVTYCYAKGVLASQDIERNLWKDDAVRSSFESDLPSFRTIRRFRRLNHDTIQTCLEKTLRRVRRVLAEITFRQNVPDEGGKPKPALRLMTTPAPGEGTTILLRKEAATRIETAALLDANSDE